MKTVYRKGNQIIAFSIFIAMCLTMILYFPEKTVNVKAAGDAILSFDWGNIQKVGMQNLSGDACGCYSWAYSKTIVDGYVHNWYEYDKSSGNNGQYGTSCMWTGGSHKTTRDKLYAFQNLYEQINNGRPTCVYVKSVNPKKTQTHWVTIIGYTGVDNINNLSESNFLAIDPATQSSLSTPINLANYYSLQTYDDGNYNLRLLNSGNVSVSGTPIYSEPVISVTVSFDCNSISATCPVQNKTVNSGGIYGNLPTPTRAGYTFTGWFTDKEAGESVTENSIVSNSSNHTLYAHWSRNTVIVTFDANGGSSSFDTLEIGVGAQLVTFPEMQRTGASFAGWYTNPAGGTKVSAGATIEDSITLYAHWTMHTITVSFNPNGGTIDTESIKVSYESSYGSLPVPEREGCTFEGWYTLPWNLTDYGINGDMLVTENTICTALVNHTLVAKWSGKDYYTIFF